MKYQIKYYYQTGNSFGSENIDNILELEWDNLDVAKQNLKRIQEHYKMYDEMESYGRKLSKQQILEKYKENDWIVLDTKPAIKFDNGSYTVIDKQDIRKAIAQGHAVGEIYDETMAQNCIKLYTDNNKVFQFWCPWCGYFERLHSAEIIPHDSNMQFEV